MSNINGLCGFSRSCQKSGAGGAGLAPGVHSRGARGAKLAADPGAALSPSTFPENHRCGVLEFFSFNHRGDA
jgi:hypothetical protein